MAEVVLDDAAIIEFFKSEPVQQVVYEAAQKVCARANASAQAVMHTPDIEPYKAKVYMADRCAVGLVTAGPIGASLDAKHGCLRSSL